MSDDHADEIATAQTRLAALEERIRRVEARLDAAERDEPLRSGHAGRPRPRFSDSGTVHPELDDQTIAP